MLILTIISKCSIKKHANKKKPRYFYPQNTFFTVTYFQVAFCGASSVLSSCCSWGVTDHILKQEWSEALHILDRHWSIRRGASSGHSVGSSIRWWEPIAIKWKSTSYKYSILNFTSGKQNFNGNKGDRIQACMPLCHLLTS